jgi:CHAD domain-containing protein
VHLRYQVPAGKSWGHLLAALGRASYGVQPLERDRFRALYLDTHDGRLRRRGLRLSLEMAGGQGRWTLSGPGERAAGPFPGDVGARLFRPGDLPLPEAAASAVAGRALIPLAGASVALYSCLLTSPSGSQLSMLLESFTPLPARGAAPPVRTRTKLLTLTFEAGEEVCLQHAGSYLRDRLGLRPEERDLIGLSLHALSRPEPGGPVPEALRVRAEDTLALAARKLVGQQALKMRANTEGTIEDLDPEYLHDLRVAARRLRSVLRLFGEPLGSRRAESLKLELAWIGRVLGAVRDLDVFILNLRTQSERLGDAGAIATVLAGELERRRAPAREHLESGLRGRRYARLLERFESLAASPVPKRPSPAAARPVAAEGPEIIRRAQRRVLNLGRGVTDKTEAPVLHRLRILFKRLRYACEFFRDAFGEELEPYIRAMVRFQDCLGEHQDAVVAMLRIRQLADEMVREGLIPQSSLLDLGSLLQVQREIARGRRRKLAELWGEFDKASVRRIPRKLARGAAGGGPGAGETIRQGPP